MQLPRGTFREIRKSVAIESLLKELNGEKYTGVATISAPSLTGTLVFKAGACILVKFRNNRGDAAWEELVKAGSTDVDAALSLLGDAQIDLALEFNKPCRIPKAVKHAPAPGSHQTAPAASRGPSRSVPAQKPAAPLKPPVKPAPPPYQVPAPPHAHHAPVHTPPLQQSRFSRTAPPIPPLSPMPPPRHPEGEEQKAGDPPEKDQDTSSFESDLDTFDTMDIDMVTDKIRIDCKTMIKQLHLDHLMER